MLTLFCLIVYGMFPSQLGIHPGWVIVSLILDIIMFYKGKESFRR